MSAKRHLKKYSRREVVAMLGAASCGGVFRDPITALLSTMTKGLIEQAYAEESGQIYDMNFIHLFQAGGVPSEVWSYFTAPRAGMHYRAFKDNLSGQVVNKQMINCIDPATGQPAHRLVTVGQVDFFGDPLRLPALWGSTIFRPDGTEVPMTNLLPNSFFGRGFSWPTNDHNQNVMRQTLPISSKWSTVGSVADRAQSLIPAISTFGAPADFYRSQRGIGIQRVGLPPNGVSGTNVDTPNLLKTATQAFDMSDMSNEAQSLFASHSLPGSSLRQAMEAALATLDTHIQDRRPGSTVLAQNREKSRDLLMAGIGNLTATWHDLHTKYLNLIHWSKGLVGGLSVIPGVTSTDSGVGYLTTVSSSDADVKNESRLGGSGHATNQDLRSAIGQDSYIRFMAGTFALAEYCVVSGLSQCFSGELYPPYGLLYTTIKNGASGTLTQWGFDEHDTGCRNSLVIGSWYHRALASCLYELITQLRIAGMYRRTVIQYATEFNRSYRVDGGGSDHGAPGSNLVLFSGQFPDRPIVTGNLFVKNQAFNSSYDCTMEGAPMNLPDGRVETPRYGVAASTLAVALGVPTQTPNDPSLIAKVDVNGTPTLVPIVPKPQNVEN